VPHCDAIKRNLIIAILFNALWFYFLGWAHVFIGNQVKFW
jgi:hypothetical protein